MFDKLLLGVSISDETLFLVRGVARIFQRGGHRGYSPDHHPGITDYIWFIPLLSPRVSAGSFSSRIILLLGVLISDKTLFLVFDM